MEFLLQVFLDVLQGVIFDGVHQDFLYPCTLLL
jgi:hypothetical protein